MNAIFLHLCFVLTKPDDTICHQIENNLQNEIVLLHFLRLWATQQAWR